MAKTKVKVTPLVKYSLWVLILSAGIFIGNYLTSLSARQPVLGEKTTGFDQFGYNNKARIFNGTGMSWCMGKMGRRDGWTEQQCATYIAPYGKDKLVMKWNAEWDRGNAESWASPLYAAWENNEWNGRVPGGSGEIWHYKIAWDKGCAEGGKPSVEAAKGGAYCLWGQFAMLQSQGSGGDRVHVWDVLLKPAGYGVK